MSHRCLAKTLQDLLQSLILAEALVGELALESMQKLLSLGLLNALFDGVSCPNVAVRHMVARTLASLTKRMVGG